jgi:hypothetical protein
MLSVFDESHWKYYVIPDTSLRSSKASARQAGSWIFLNLAAGAFLDIQNRASSIVPAYRRSYFFPE